MSPVDLERQPDGRLHFSLGPVERWVVAVGASILVAVAYWFTSSVTVRLDKQNDGMQILVTQQAVMSGQIQTLSAQLADVPRVSRQVAELQVRVEQHSQDIKEMRQLRGVR